MDDLQREILRSLLRNMERTPPQHRMEVVEVALNTRLGLYRQENDPEGARVYEQLQPIVKNAKSVEELEALVR